MATYTVVKGDTLTGIAAKYNGVSVNDLLNWNPDITNPNLIYVGQKIVVSKDSAKTATKKASNKPTITAFGIQSGTDSTLFATWSWTRENTDKYTVKWEYATGDGIWFMGNESDINIKQATWSIPANATKVRFRVKPISKKKKDSKGNETAYWTDATWSTEKIYYTKDLPPAKPSAPDVKIENVSANQYKLTATLNGITDTRTSSIQYQVVKNNSTVVKTGTAGIKTQYSSYSCTVDAGVEYKVRCRGCRGSEYGEWSDYSSSKPVNPPAPKSIKTCAAKSDTSVFLEWTSVSSAKSYDIQYAEDKAHFDTTDLPKDKTGVTTTSWTFTELETGKKYFFRVRAVNDAGPSGWSPIKSTAIGKRPSAPTTWSSNTTAFVGEPITLYWMHNSQDGSSETYAHIIIYADGVQVTEKVLANTRQGDEKDLPSAYVFDTSGYKVGAEIKWKVQTTGVLNDQDYYSDWSIERIFYVRAPAVLQLSVTDNTETDINTVTSFPFSVLGISGPDTPIGCKLSIIANESYETVDTLGNPTIISSGDTVYSNYFDTFDINGKLIVEMSAHNVNLENNISYSVNGIVTLNTGATTESSYEFKVAWDDLEYAPTASIGIDTDSYTASIGPYCVDVDGNPVPNMLLSVYRREYDGRYTEIATGLDSGEDGESITYVTDPHPALDYARYRIVATDKSTGAVSYCDLPGHYVGCKSIIIQWDDTWTSFDGWTEDPTVERPWAGSMLKLNYNIDITDNYSPDVAFVEYIGRSHPVSYYGTHLGEAGSWNTVIEKNDTETIYALRRLAIYPGNVYVRSPNGIGYWANVTVSFSEKHLDQTIPVTLGITRVEGGM